MKFARPWGFLEPLVLWTLAAHYIVNGRAAARTMSAILMVLKFLGFYAPSMMKCRVLCCCLCGLLVLSGHVESVWHDIYGDHSMSGLEFSVEGLQDVNTIVQFALLRLHWGLAAGVMLKLSLIHI